jgi:hypothetical protein
MATEVIIPGVGSAQLLTGPAKRRRGPAKNSASKKALVKAEAALARSRKSARALRASIGGKGIVYMGVGFALGLLLSGLLDAFGVDDIFGFDARYVVGGVLVAIAFMGGLAPMMALGMGAGGLAVLAPAASDSIDELVTGMFTPAQIAPPAV